MGLLEGVLTTMVAALLAAVQSDDTEKEGIVEINTALTAALDGLDSWSSCLVLMLGLQAHIATTGCSLTRQLCYILVLCSCCQLAFNCQGIWAMEFCQKPPPGLSFKNLPSPRLERWLSSGV